MRRDQTNEIAEHYDITAHRPGSCRLRSRCLPFQWLEEGIALHQSGYIQKLLRSTAYPRELSLVSDKIAILYLCTLSHLALTTSTSIRSSRINLIGIRHEGHFSRIRGSPKQLLNVSALVQGDPFLKPFSRYVSRYRDRIPIAWAMSGPWTPEGRRCHR